MPKAKQFNAALQALKNKLPKGMFSTLDELIEAAPQDRMTVKQWKEYLAPGRVLTREGINFPLKKEELDYSLGGFLNTDHGAGEDAMIEKRNIQELARRQRPRIQGGLRDDEDPKLSMYSQYSTQGPNRLHYFESITGSPDIGEFGTHYNDDTISWHRGNVHALEPSRDPRMHPDSPTLRLIDEIQSDRHSAAAERLKATNEQLQDRMEQTGEGAREAGAALDKLMPRRGYRTPEQQARFRQLSGTKNPHPSMSAIDAVRNEFMDLRATPPDAPFKDPADYGRLELKRGILDAISHGNTHVGITPSEGPIGWFNFNKDRLDLDDPELMEAGELNPQIMGSKYAYDKIYPGELRKLANQYGAPFTQVDLPIVDKNMNQLAQVEESGAADLPDFMDMVLDNEPNEYGHAQLRNVLQELDHELTDLPEADKRLREAHELSRQIDTSLNTHGSGLDSQLEDVQKLADKLVELDNMRLGLTGPRSQQTRKVPAMELTPEVVEKIKKAGIPLWAITSGLIGLDAMRGEGEKKPTYKTGGKVEQDDDPEEIQQQIRDQEVMRHRKNNALATIDRAAQVMGSPEKSGRRRHLMAGLASQLYGLDTKGDAKFLGFDPGRKPTGPPTSMVGGILSMFRPGIVDETMALPNMFGTGPKWSKDAEKRTEDLGERVNQSMNDLQAPQGFAENLSRAGGTMLGQLPIGAEKATVEAVEHAPGILNAVGRKIKQYGTGATEFFSPTVQPSLGNYASGSAFGGVLGTLPEWLQSYLEQHPEAAEAAYNAFRESTPQEQSMLQQQLLSGPAMAKGGPVSRMKEIVDLYRQEHYAKGTPAQKAAFTKMMDREAKLNHNGDLWAMIDERNRQAALLDEADMAEGRKSSKHALGGEVEIPEYGRDLREDAIPDTSGPKMPLPPLEGGTLQTIGGSMNHPRYIGSPKTEAELAHYGSGPETRYFDTSSAPLSIDFSKTGTGVSMPTATKGGSSGLGNAVTAGLGLYKGLGKLDSVLGTGMQSGIKNGVLNGIKGIFGAGAAAPAGTLASVGAPALSIGQMAAAGGAEAAATLGGASAAGAGAAGAGASSGLMSGLTAAAPYAAAALAAYGLYKAVGKKKAKNKGTYDPATGQVTLTKTNVDDWANKQGLSVSEDDVNNFYSSGLNEYARILQQSGGIKGKSAKRAALAAAQAALPSREQASYLDDAEYAALMQRFQKMTKGRKDIFATINKTIKGSNVNPKMLIGR